MTSSELNRDIKRLAKRFKIFYNENTNNWTNEDWDKHIKKDKEIEKEFIRLYGADDKFESMNISSIICMLVINHKRKYIPQHIFGLNINFDKLIK